MWLIYPNVTDSFNILFNQNGGWKSIFFVGPEYLCWTSVTSALGSNSKMDPLTRVILSLYAMDLPDSPLVQFLEDLLVCNI